MDLTGEMKDLRKDLESLREERFKLIDAIRKGVNHLRIDVLKTREALHNEHRLLAQKSKRDRQDFVADLKQSVGKFRDEVSTDLLGARSAWFSIGLKHTIEPAKQEGKEHIKQNVEEHVKPHVEEHVKPHVEEHVKPHVEENVKDHLEDAKQHSEQQAKQRSEEHVKPHGLENSKRHQDDHESHKKDFKKSKMHHI
ncbi:MAG: hypothetical protein ACH350_03105 [Parachlamydiaceae bacterium]